MRAAPHVVALTTALAIVASARCVPVIPISGKPCTSDADCVSPDGALHFCQLENPNQPQVCMFGANAGVAPRANRGPIVEAAFVLGVVDEVITGQLTFFDPDGDPVALDVDDAAAPSAITVAGIQVGTILLRRDGGFVITAQAEQLEPVRIPVRVVDAPPPGGGDAVTTSSVLAIVLVAADGGDLLRW